MVRGNTRFISSVEHDMIDMIEHDMIDMIM
jgi:hypothetical protein